MSGETRGAVSGWTVDTSRENLLTLMDERDRRYEQRFVNVIEAQRVAKEAVGTALLAQEGLVQRAEAVNDKRFEVFTTARRMSDEASRQMMPRIEAEQRYAALEQQIRQLEKAQGERFTEQGARLDRNEGRSGGFSAGWAYLIAAITGVASIIGIIAFALSSRGPT